MYYRCVFRTDRPSCKVTRFHVPIEKSVVLLVLQMQKVAIVKAIGSWLSQGG
jgi:hypothetical protein